MVSVALLVRLEAKPGSFGIFPSRRQTSGHCPESESEMKNEDTGMKIPLQVGSELRIKKNGELSVDNPELELSEQASAADAVLSYHFDPQTGEHILRLLDPVANHKHMRVHHRDD
jgi:hypothetical protein